MPYRFIEDVTLAGVAFEATGETVEEMFISSADALMKVMLSDPTTVERALDRSLSIQSESLEMLLVELLRELIFFKNSEQLLLRVQEMTIGGGDGRFELTANAYGETIDPGKHDLIVDVKAVTFHRYKVESRPEGWFATVVLDI